MIENAKQAKALGLAWLNLKFSLPDGARLEIKGPYSNERVFKIYEVASADDHECTRIAKASGNYGVPT